MKDVQKILLRILVCFLLIQCSSNSTHDQPEYTRTLDDIPQDIQEVENLTVFSGDAEPTHSVELKPEQTFGKQGKPYLTKVNGCIIDDKGRVIINDFDKKKEYGFPNVLYAYNADGSYRTQIGRPGRGPGEYSFIFDMQAKAGKVIVFDLTNKRLNVYDTDGYALDRTILLENFKNTNDEAAKGLEFEYVRARMDGNYLVTFSNSAPSADNPTNIYLLMDTDGNLLDFEPLEFPSSPSIRPPKSNNPQSPSLPLPFLGQSLITLTNDDALYSVWSREFLIKKYDPNGTYQSAIYYPIEGPPFDLQKYAKAAPFNYKTSEIEKAFEKADKKIPKTARIIADLKVDDQNRIWVAIPTGIQSETYEWWILEESGRLLAKLTLPRDKPIYDIKNGYLYSKKTNKETGTEYVVKYRIELTKG
ncbi:MAG: 6-bladed beta-propeller [Fodinibius sp.]|nr:6-bladed beta-propeller [Fodinibius sp.]